MALLTTYSNLSFQDGFVVAILNDSGDSYSYRFQPDINLTVSGVSLTGSPTGVPPNYLVSIQSNKGTNVPTGTMLGSMAFSFAGNFQEWSIPQYFPTNVNLTSGTTYHLRIDSSLVVGSPTTQNNIGLIRNNSSNTEGRFIPNSQARMANIDVLTSANSGDTWSASNRTPIFTLLLSDNSAWGFPWANSNVSEIISGQTLIGNLINFNTNETISGIEAVLRQTAATLIGSVVWEMRIGSPWQTINNSGYLANGVDTTNGSSMWLGSYFTPISITSGQQIIFSLKSTPSTGSFIQRTGSTLLADNATYQNITSRGSIIQFAKSTDGGTTWSIDPSRDALIRLYSAAITITGVSVIPVMQPIGYWGPI